MIRHITATLPTRHVVPLLLAASYFAVAVGARGETLTLPDGQRVAGRLVMEHGKVAFVPQNGTKAAPLEPGSVIAFASSTTDAAPASAPFRLELWLDQQLSGRLGAIDANSARLVDGPGGAATVVARPGLRAVVQRPGEAQVFHDDFETLDETQWDEVGDPAIVGEPRIAGKQSLRIPAGASAVTHRLTEPLVAGKLEVAFHDDGMTAAGHSWFVDLLFRGPAGPESVRAVLGWSEDTLAVESSGGLSLSVQRLARRRGWHRLAVRFSSERTEVSVDGDELAHGKGPAGPLVEIRLASMVAGKPPVPAGLAGHIDDLRLARFAEPAASIEIDPAQDEARLISGDQLFGALQSADSRRLSLRVLGRDVALSWGEVSGLYFRRAPVQSQLVQGLLARAVWRPTPGASAGDLDQIEGALVGVSDTTLSVATPYSGTLAIPRDALVRLAVQRQGSRVVIDPTAHHLGNQLTKTAPLLDPPQPENGPLVRTLTLDQVPGGPAFVVLDVVQVIGESSGGSFAQEVRDGSLRTNVKVNGKLVDYLNRHITSSNETPERIRLALPADLLRAGKNEVRIEQTGRPNEPEEVDDMGVLGIAFEFDAPGDAPQKP